jgi:phenylacetate-CoA ligase
MDDVERLSFEEQLALQERALPAQIERVRAGSAFYGERLDPAAPLAQQPFVTKSELLAAQAEDPPLGPLAGVSQEDIVRLHVTSGTTGTPLLIGFTRGDLERSSLAGARAFRSAGVTPADTILHCVNYAFYAGGIADHMSLEATGATVVPVGLGQSDRLLDLFPSLRPTGIFSITSYANHLAERARAKGLDPADLGLRRIVTGGEPGGDIPEVRVRIEATWGARVADTYGLGEVWPTSARSARSARASTSRRPTCSSPSSSIRRPTACSSGSPARRANSSTRIYGARRAHSSGSGRATGRPCSRSIARADAASRASGCSGGSTT